AELVEDLLQRPLGVDPLLADDVGGARQQHRILEHQELCVEERSELRASQRHARLDIDQLIARLEPALVEPDDLVGDPGRGNLVAQHLEAVDQQHGAAGDDARGDADALQALHASSPKPDCTSATSASTAPSSSRPSAEIVIVDPRAAASSRMPMMLLPSISRASRATRTRDSNRVARWTNLAAAR